MKGRKSDKERNIKGMESNKGRESNKVGESDNEGESKGDLMGGWGWGSDRGIFNVPPAI
jgi:hypothetical protein